MESSIRPTIFHQPSSFSSSLSLFPFSVVHLCLMASLPSPILILLYPLHGKLSSSSFTLANLVNKTRLRQAWIRRWLWNSKWVFPWVTFREREAEQDQRNFRARRGWTFYIVLTIAQAKIRVYIMKTFATSFFMKKAPGWINEWINGLMDDEMKT